MIQTLYYAVACVVLALESTPQERVTLSARAWIESRLEPFAKGKLDDCGFWQIRASQHGTTCHRLKFDPVHTTRKAIAIHRQYVRWCGRDGEPTCWRYGPNHKQSRRFRK